MAASAAIFYSGNGSVIAKKTASECSVITLR